MLMAADLEAPSAFPWEPLDDDIVKYSTVSGGRVYFNAADFNAACREITGDSLRYVQFTPPASRYGKLYDQYGGSEAAVTSSTSYYRSGSSRRLDDVSFLAASSYTGHSLHRLYRQKQRR